MSISERIIELGKKWGDPEAFVETLATRIDPPVYSHPQMVYDLACDLVNTAAELESAIDQLQARVPKIATTVGELEALPIGCLILELESELEKFAFPWVKVAIDGGPPMWSAPGDEQDYKATEVNLPAYVMWTPPA